MIGKTGKVFIVNDSGEIIFPLINDLKKSTFSPNLVKKAFTYYLDKNRQNDFLFSRRGVKFMAHVSEMPPLLGTKHLNIVILAPFDDFFSKILRMWKKVFGIILAILIISAIIVVYFSDRIAAPIVALSKEIDKVRNLQLEEGVRIQSTVKEIILMDASVAAMRNAIRSISRYVPKGIVKEFFLQGKDVVLGGEQKRSRSFFPILPGLQRSRKRSPSTL